jgi:hypothetical protein
MAKPLKREWIDAADIAERRFIDMVGRALGIPDPVRDEIAEIIDPQFKLLRREGRRNGRLPPAPGEV